MGEEENDSDELMVKEKIRMEDESEKEESVHMTQRKI